MGEMGRIDNSNKLLNNEYHETQKIFIKQCHFGHSPSVGSSISCNPVILYRKFEKEIHCFLYS